MFNAERFGGGNLDMVDIPAVPEGLEQRVGKTEHEDILNGFFGQIVIDPVDLTFLKVVPQEGVKLSR
jgi:hypothetical protein